MPIPQSKQELLDAIKLTYLKLQKDLENIPEEFTQAKEMDGHAKESKMSVCNLVSYLIGWGELVLKWNQKDEKGLDIDFPETGFKWNELGDLAQKFYVDYNHLNYLELLESLDDTVDKLLRLVERKDNNVLYGSSWYKQYTLGRMIQLNTSSPYKNARTRVRKWKKSNGL